jgi:hypothetical protein
MKEKLDALAVKIAQELSIKPEYFVTHPAEVKVFQSLTHQQLRDFAREHGWLLVTRLGGRRIEFYNDAGARETAQSEK